ncbi:hypothetical protein AB0D34_08045 [Streptomyces sp. NPDC048420]|uniref:hypothetical protein n=1 Tax=Streptomyces sp. NPDC048420 TaxID=3155755 RepID=UPI003432E879
MEHGPFLLDAYGLMRDRDGRSGGFVHARATSSRLPVGLQMTPVRPEETPQELALLDPRGRPLASLYLLEDEEGYLERAAACHRLLEQARKGRASDVALAEALDDVERSLLIGDQLKSMGWVDGFGRVLAVMRLLVPPLLREALAPAEGAGPTAVSSPSAAHNKIIHVVNGGQRDDCNTHRLLYVP